MTDSLLSSDPGTQKRRSTRIVQAIPLTVSGMDALGQPFKERTTTVMVNCHGCKYQSKHYVPKNSLVTLDIPRPEPSLPPRQIQGRVVWVQRPRSVRELFQIGLEFDIAGNVWGIAFPPEDWFAHPDDAPVATAAPPTAQKATAYSPEFPLQIAREVPPSVPAETANAEQPEKKAESPNAAAP
ncbi:MAG: PilZ domain-containing protein, partial [Blastocatellia bacterium]